MMTLSSIQSMSRKICHPMKMACLESPLFRPRRNEKLRDHPLSTRSKKKARLIAQWLVFSFPDLPLSNIQFKSEITIQLTLKAALTRSNGSHYLWATWDGSGKLISLTPLLALHSSLLMISNGSRSMLDITQWVQHLRTFQKSSMFSRNLIQQISPVTTNDA